MEKKLSYRATIGRPQAFRDIFYTWILVLSSWPRLLLEVFIRRNFGERYFSFSSTILVTVVLAYYPFVRESGLHLFSSYGYGYGYGAQQSTGDIIRQNWLWYLYLTAFFIVALQRRREIQHEPGQFNFARYSLSTGDIKPFFFDIEFGGKAVTRRTIETLLEPGLFFFIGLGLWFLGQPLGKLFVFCAFGYGLSYRAMYRIGDNFVLDWIDKLIINREMSNSFADDQDSSQTNGFYFYGRRPADPNFRRELAGHMIEKDDSVEAM